MDWYKELIKDCSNFIIEHYNKKLKVNEMKRYIIKNGKFGNYFYDTLTNTDLTLKKVKELLNKFDILETIEINRKYKK